METLVDALKEQNSASIKTQLQKELPLFLAKAFLAKNFTGYDNIIFQKYPQLRKGFVFNFLRYSRNGACLILCFFRSKASI